MPIDLPARRPATFRLSAIMPTALTLILIVFGAAVLIAVLPASKGQDAAMLNSIAAAP